MEIEEEIWSAWRKESEEYEEWALLLLLSPVGDVSVAERALRKSVQEVEAAFDAQAERSGSAEPFIGEWDWMRVSDGVLVQVVECEDFEAMLPAVAAALERRGIEGAFHLHDWPTVAEPPWAAHMLECRLRVRGERLRRGPRDYIWQPDPDAQAAILAVAERWCRRHGEDATHSLQAGGLVRVPVEADEEVLDRMGDAVAHSTPGEVSAVAADEFRSVSVPGWSGSGAVSLVEGGALIDAGHWARALAELTGVLRDHADLLAYGYVKRGWAVKEALLLDDSLGRDWPRRSNYRPRGIGFTKQAFEDLYAPDAFAVQLLGPGYVGRLTPSATWRAEQVGTGSVLLEHVDLPAWFDVPFVPLRYEARHGQQPQPPGVLAQARDELAPILYSPGVLTAAGYPDADVK